MEVMHRISRLVQDDFQIPPEDIEVGKERGQFASIYFTVDVAEQYVPLFWQQAQMTKNLLVQCGVMAIQVGSGPMLWMVNPYQPPPQPLAGKHYSIASIMQCLCVCFLLLCGLVCQPAAILNQRSSSARSWSYSAG